MRARSFKTLLSVSIASLISAAWSFNAAGQSGRPAEAGFSTTVQPFLAKNCYGCHNERLSSGNLNLTQYKTAAAIAQDREQWERLLKKVRGGEMPPKQLPRPAGPELSAAMKWIEGELDRLDRTAKPDPGRVTARRLNRAEYNNTVKDLLGVDFRPADDFPQDDSGYGFDNNGDVLSLSVVQVEKYLTAAEMVARTAIYGPQVVKPTMARYQPAGRRRPGDPDNLFFNNHPYLSLTSYDETGLSMPNSFHVTHQFPATAEYVIRATPDNGSRPPGSEPLEMAAWIDGKLVGTTSIDGQLEGKTQEFRVKVTEGQHEVAVGFPRQFEGLPVLYAAKNPSTRPVPERGRRGGGFQQPPPNATPEQLAAFEARRAAFAAGRGGRGGAPNAANNDDVSDVFFTPPGAPPGTRLARADNMGFQSLEIGGPHNPEVRPSDESVKKIRICKSEEPGCDRKIISRLARLAYRRPVPKEEVDELMAHATRARLRGDPFDEQLVVAIEAMLVTPHFLFRIEKDRAPKAGDSYYLNDYELASRLSYFLWSSLPDEELLRCADQGTLRRPEVLAAQTRRMLKDPKMIRFVRNFGGQWLQTRALESHAPDYYKFPQFDNYLGASMVQETEMFFANIIREDRNILEFLDADYTFVNEYLGQYYGLRDVKGPEFRKVSLEGTPRRGILGQASVLTASSYANRTSVVLRGKWVLENLLNAPPPPPPADVPDLEQAKVGENATLRERMESHRANVVCAGCHSRMDPLGFGLENFDAAGNWRDKEGKSPINASGTLPDGRTFNGPVELAALLRSENGAFVQCVTEKMLIYGLGRGLEPYDRPAVKKITAAVAANQYRFSSLVLEIVKSMPFQMRRGERGKV